LGALQHTRLYGSRNLKSGVDDDQNEYHRITNFNATTERENYFRVDCYLTLSSKSSCLCCTLKMQSTMFNRAFSMRLSRFEEYLRKLFMEGAGATWPFYGMVSHVAVIGSRNSTRILS